MALLGILREIDVLQRVVPERTRRQWDLDGW
jgi:hypothetical protein